MGGRRHQAQFETSIGGSGMSQATAVDGDVIARQSVRIELNGEWVEHAVTPRTSLGDFLRDDCGVTGTHLACEHGVCGACNVLLDDKPVRSCITLTTACVGKSVRTIEGYEDDRLMEELRDAFSREHGLQCGFCTPGMLSTAYDIVRRLPDADEKRIRYELSGNLCRCTGYVGIVRAIQSVLAEQKANPIEPQAAAAVAGVPPSTKMAGSAAAGAMAQFSPINDEEVAATQPETPQKASESSGNEPRRGWTRMEDSFDVDFDADRVWAAMTDVETMASCLPGAEIDENEGSKVSGRVRVKFGPIKAAFNGAATLEFDEQHRRGVLQGAGTDSISKSRAKGDIQYDVVRVDDGLARVKITLDYLLQGPLAQFSRSGLVKEFVSHLIADFGQNLVGKLSGTGAPVESSGAQMSVMKIFMKIVWARLKRLFGVN